jgi:hypothetical protein
MPVFSKVNPLDNKYCTVESNLFFVIFSMFLLPNLISNSALISFPNVFFVSKNVFNNNSVVISFCVISVFFAIISYYLFTP